MFSWLDPAVGKFLRAHGSGSNPRAAIRQPGTQFNPNHGAHADSAPDCHSDPLAHTRAGHVLAAGSPTP